MIQSYSERKYIILTFLIFIVVLYIIRLYYLQVADPTYKLSAENNSKRIVVEYPARGLIYDRDTNLLVYNEITYDVIINPRQLTTFDTLELSRILNVSLSDLKKKINTNIQKSPYKTSVIYRQIESKIYSELQEKLFAFNGFEIQRRTIRRHPKKIAAHLLGYLGEVSETTIQKNSYYKPGDYIGMSGIELAYEELLRGKKGVKMFLVDVHNRIQGSFQNGKYDTLAHSGKNIYLTLDAEIQEYCELLMTNKRGSIVVIDPRDGGIIALVSSPSYDPNLLVGKERSENYSELLKEEDKPLYNRALMAHYPPGSTFKMVNALIGLQEGVMTTSSTFPCHAGFHVGNFSIKCHHGGQVGLEYSIMSSCNAYYCHVFREILEGKSGSSIQDNYVRWTNYLNKFCIGVEVGSDVGYESKGFLPAPQYYDRFYGVNKWKPLMLVSMSIGQGELGITPFQMATMTSIIASKGLYYLPHIIKSVDIPNDPKRLDIDPKFLTKRNVGIDTEYFEPIINGMGLVVSGGTAGSVSYPKIAMCGKTGTAQNPHGEDHSIFVAFAPKDNPQVAMSVYVENGGFGAQWAAPIASLIAEKVLTDSIKRPDLESRIINSNLILMNKEKQQKLQETKKYTEKKLK